MGKIISVINQKGGVGKTTTAVNLTSALGARNKKVLLCDTDPQGNSTTGLGIPKNSYSKTCYDMIINDTPIESCILKTKFKGVDLIPAGIDLAGAELELCNLNDRMMKIKNPLLRVKDKYDYIIIDCPPSLGLLTVNALSASDTVLIPIQCEFYALEGLSQLMNTIRKVKSLYNPRIDIEGVLLTMYDSRTNLTLQVADEVKKYFPKKVFKSVIPVNVRLSEAPSFGQPINYYDPTSKGAAAYEMLADEVLRN